MNGALFCLDETVEEVCKPEPKKQSKKRNTLSTTHFQIFDYWKDKAITKDGEIVPDTKEYFKISIPVIEDWGEPTCWCCGKHIDIFSMKGYNKALKDGDLKRIWNYAKVKKYLNRAHIIPKALGGNPSADNLFLLCSNCHACSPDFVIPKMFYKYIYNVRTTSGGLNNLSALNILCDSSYSVTDFIESLHNENNLSYEKLNEIITQDSLFDVVSKMCNIHGTSMSLATYKAALTYLIESNRKE